MDVNASVVIPCSYPVMLYVGYRSWMVLIQCPNTLVATTIVTLSNPYTFEIIWIQYIFGTYKYIYIYTYNYTYIHIYIYRNTHTNVYIYIHACIYTHIYIYIYTYVYHDIPYVFLMYTGAAHSEATCRRWNRLKRWTNRWRSFPDIERWAMTVTVRPPVENGGFNQQAMGISWDSVFQWLNISWWVKKTPISLMVYDA